MENIPRNLEKTVVKFTPPKFTKRPRQWDVVFINNEGRTRHIGWFKSVAFLFLAIFIVALAGDVFLYSLYRKERFEKNSKELELTYWKKQTESLKFEREKLIAKEIVEGKKVEELPLTVPAQKPPEKTMPVIPLEPSIPEAPPVQPPEPKPDTKTDIAITIPDEPKRESNASEPAKVETPKRISVDEFWASYKQKSKMLKLQFNLSNIDPKAEPIAGFVFVTLKPGGSGSEKWLTLTAKEPVSGKPSDYQTGQTFSISRGKTASFETIQSDPKRFKTATVSIFDKSGDLLLEKDFPFKVE